MLSEFAALQRQYVAVFNNVKFCRKRIEIDLTMETCIRLWICTSASFNEDDDGSCSGTSGGGEGEAHVVLKLRKVRKIAGKSESWEYLGMDAGLVPHQNSTQTYMALRTGALGAGFWKAKFASQITFTTLIYYNVATNLKWLKICHLMELIPAS